MFLHKERKRRKQKKPKINKGFRVKTGENGENSFCTKIIKKALAFAQK